MNVAQLKEQLLKELKIEHYRQQSIQQSCRLNAATPCMPTVHIAYSQHIRAKRCGCSAGASNKSAEPFAMWTERRVTCTNPYHNVGDNSSLRKRLSEHTGNTSLPPPKGARNHYLIHKITIFLTEINIKKGRGKRRLPVFPLCAIRFFENEIIMKTTYTLNVKFDKNDPDQKMKVLHFSGLYQLKKKKYGLYFRF